MLAVKSGTNYGGKGIVSGAIVVIEEHSAAFLVNDALATFGVAPAVAQKIFLLLIVHWRGDNQRRLSISQPEVKNFLVLNLARLIVGGGDKFAVIVGGLVDFAQVGIENIAAELSGGRLAVNDSIRNVREVGNKTRRLIKSFKEHYRGLGTSRAESLSVKLNDSSNKKFRQQRFAGGDKTFAVIV